MNPLNSDVAAVTPRVSNIREALKVQLDFHQIEAARIRRALIHLGVQFPSAPRRAIALRDYLIAHPNEVVTTRAIKANPAKFGIITAAQKLQLNWLYGSVNPTSRNLFEVAKGVIKLRPPSTNDSPACQES